MAKCLVLIDLQNDYFDGGKNSLSGSLEAVHKAKILLDHFRKSSNCICHIKHISSRPGATFFLKDTIGCEINEIVKPDKDEPVFIKSFPNSFRDTELFNYLKSNGIDHLVISGMMTHMCVDATTRAAFDLGFKCTVIYDACATKALQIKGNMISAADVHNSFMAAFNGIYADVVTTEEYLNSVS
jgi:nicotinamidase-related amidase